MSDDLAFSSEADPIALALAELSATDATTRYAAVGRLIAIGDPAVALLIEALSSRNALEREAILSALVGIGEPAVARLKFASLSQDRNVYEGARLALRKIKLKPGAEAAREQLQREIAALSKRRNKRLLLLSGRAVIALVAALSMTWIGRLVPALRWLSDFAQFLVIGSIVGSGVDATVQTRRHAIDMLSSVEDKRMVGAFALCLLDPSREVRYAAATALKKLLPRIQASDKDTLSPPEMEALLRALGGKDNLLTIAILKALEQVGDERALPKVEGLARLKNGKPAEVRHAAEKCLPYLHLRAQQAEQAHTLLRAASSDATSDTLLRPAAGTASVDTGQLLRPHVGSTQCE